jgi:hypothetical protein
MLDDIRFWMQVTLDAKRTLVVPPELESRAIEMVKAHGCEHVVTVRVSEVLPEGAVYWVDEQALDASLRQTVLTRIRM